MCAPWQPFQCRLRIWILPLMVPSMADDDDDDDDDDDGGGGGGGG